MTTGVIEPAEQIFSSELQDQLGEYPNKWVAVLDSQVVAVADDPGTAYKSAVEEIGNNDAIVLHHLPKAERAAYFF